MTLREAIHSARLDPMGPVVASHTMKRFRLVEGPNGEETATEEDVLIEISEPKEHQLDDFPVLFWTCSLRLSCFPEQVAACGHSSLEAILHAVQVAAAMLKAMPFWQEIDRSLLPNFGLPVCSMTTTPEALAAEQARAEDARKRFETLGATPPPVPEV
jgi:hypothetical protein